MERSVPTKARKMSSIASSLAMTDANVNSLAPSNFGEGPALASSVAIGLVGVIHEYALAA
jgi:hypothetical protein